MFILRLKNIVIALLTSLLIGFCLLSIVYMIPSGKIVKHVSDSIAVFKVENSYRFTIPGCPSTICDNYTDAIYLNESIVNSKDTGILQAALSGYVYQPIEDIDQVKQLSAVIENYDNSHQLAVEKLKSNHRRFWNGYEVPLRTMLCFTTYSHIREFNMYTHLLLFVAFIGLLFKRSLERFVPAFFLVYLFLNPKVIGDCLAFAGYFYCTIIPCIFILLFNDFLLKNERYYFFFTCVGASVFYFNMNYFQLISYGIPLIVYYLRNDIKSIKEMFKQGAGFFIAWFAGYSGMMVGKWLLYAVFVSSDIFVEMYQAIMLRSSASANVGEFSRVMAIGRNFKTAIANKIWLAFELVFIVYCLLKAKFGINFNKKAVSFFMLTCILLVLTLFRYFVLANHVYVHHWVTYRILAMPLLSFNVMLCYLLGKGEKKIE